MEKYGFVYIWYDRKRKMYYIGSHWGTENDGYICSSNRMRDAHRRRPEDFKRRVIEKVYTNKETLLEVEHKWLLKIGQNELGIKYYNLRQHKWGHWSTNPQKVLNMKERNRGENNPMYGKPSTMKGKTHTESARLKIKEKRAKQVISEETKRKISESHIGEKNHFYGKQHTEEAKRKMSETKKGRKLTLEHRERCRQSALNRWSKKKEELRC